MCVCANTHTEGFTLPGEDVCCYGYRQKRAIIGSMNYISEVGGAYRLLPVCTSSVVLETSSEPSAVPRSAVKAQVSVDKHIIALDEAKLIFVSF